MTALRSHSLTALQSALRMSLLVFSSTVVTLYASIIYIERTYPKVDPQHPKRLSYICFSQENDDFIAVYMNIVRITDIGLSIVLSILCMILGCSKSHPGLHWPISGISAVRFIIVLIEIVHISSFTGDTQLDIILSVSDGLCKVADNQRTAFNALLATFVLRCVKGYISINMATLAYGNSILIFLFGLDDKAIDPESNEEHELEEMNLHLDV